MRNLSHQTPPYMPVPKPTTSRGAGLPILINGSQDPPLGLGPAALKHRPHIGRRIP